MTRALLLIDLQHDYLNADGLVPGRLELIDHATSLLADFRRSGCPVVHVWTTVRSPSDAMPHWQEQGRVICREGSEGHASPAALSPLPAERIQHKRVFSAFADGSLAPWLRGQGVDTVVLAGLHLRTCVRTAALDAYQQGFRVWIAAAATADNDPLQAALSRRYLEDRQMRFLAAETLSRWLRYGGDAPAADRPSSGTLHPSSGALHRSPTDPGCVLWSVLNASHQQIDGTVAAAAQAASDWSRKSLAERFHVAETMAQQLQQGHGALAGKICRDTGKPISAARQEVDFAIGLIQAAQAAVASAPSPWSGVGWISRRLPHGVVAAITPWNNPLAIPLGKLIPALLQGNTVVWKPAIHGSGVARRCLALLDDAGLPPGCVGLVEGDAETAQRLMEHPDINAITLTGSSQAGLAAQIIAARRCVPLQAELGGNNSAIVWTDADLEETARVVAEGAFSCAGQRCTANRRVIVANEVAVRFLSLLREATAALPWGDPFDPRTLIGPVISEGAAERILQIIERARRNGATIWQPHPGPELTVPSPCHVPPTLILSSDPQAEWVQRESFGPILIVQTAKDWNEALALCNDVRQGLVASLFSSCPERQRSFLSEAKAGILKLNASTAGAAAAAPFGGWKESGIGPPEHGPCDIDFYSLIQTIYNS